MKKVHGLLLAIIMLLNFAGCDAPGPAPQQDSFRFTYNGTGIVLNSDAAPVIAQLGQPQSYTEETSCAFDGLDKTYYYGSFYLSTYPLDGRDYVYSVWFVDDSIATEEGVRIGSTQSEVDEIYGSDSYNGTNAYTLTKGDTKLTVILEDGAVGSIQYEMIVE